MERNEKLVQVRHNLTYALAGTALLVVALVLASTVEAQFRIFGGVRGQTREETTDAVTLVSERETTVLLDKAKDLIAKGEITLALSALQKILGDAENADQPDTFFKSEGQRGLSGGVRAEAQRLIGQLNDEQRATYELQFGVTARQMLDDAVQAGRIDRVAEVVRRVLSHQDGLRGGGAIGAASLGPRPPSGCRAVAGETSRHTNGRKTIRTAAFAVACFCVGAGWLAGQGKVGACGAEKALGK